MDMVKTLVIPKTVRSGKTIKHDGDICIIGDTNPAVTIMAGGNIFVFGEAKGTLIAGIITGDTATIVANRFLSHHTQIGKYLVKGEPEDKGYAESISVVNGLFERTKIKTKGGEVIG